MTIEKKIILLFEEASRKIEYIESIEKKYDLSLNVNKKISFLPEYMTIRLLSIISYSFLLLSLLISIILVYVTSSSNIVIFFIMPLIVFAYAYVNRIIFDEIVDKNFFKIKERLQFYTLKIWKNKREIFFIRKANFKRELPEIREAISIINSNQKEIKDLIEQCDMDVLTETYIKMLLSEQIEDNKYFILELLRLGLSSESIAKIKKYKLKKIQMENIFEY